MKIVGIILITPALLFLLIFLGVILVDIFKTLSRAYSVGDDYSDAGYRLILLIALILAIIGFSILLP